jgi:GT2 family glycosyltransferase
LDDVSVCLGIPTLNRGEYVAKTIAQALEQSVRPTEIVVYDQGETDEKVREEIVGAAGGVVRWIQGERPSLTAARNQILLCTTCDVVAFVDDDVLLPATFVERCVEKFKEDQVVCLQCGIFQRHDDVEVDKLAIDNRSTTCFPQFDYDQFQDAHFLLFGCHAVRREVAITVGGYDEQFVGSAFGEDVEFGQRVLRAGHGIHYDPEWWLVHVRAPQGGCRIHEWPAWMESCNLWLSIARYGLREGRFGVLFWASLRHGPLLKRNVLSVWRQPAAWASYLFGMAIGIRRGIRQVVSPFSRGH